MMDEKRELTDIERLEKVEGFMKLTFSLIAVMNPDNPSTMKMFHSVMDMANELEIVIHHLQENKKREPIVCIISEEKHI